MVARLLAERLGPALGETVIVENRPGQGGSIALASLAQSPADGHTLVLAPLASLVVNPHLYKSVGYNTLKDLAPVALVADLPLLLVVNPSLPVKSVAELIAYAKANPEKLAHPSSGNGTLSHLGMEVFKQRAGITILHVPYRGSVPAMTDLMTGIVGVAMDTVAVTEPFIRGDKMRLIASAYGKRVAAFPDTPTVAEQGFAEVRPAGRHRQFRWNFDRVWCLRDAAGRQSESRIDRSIPIGQIPARRAVTTGENRMRRFVFVALLAVAGAGEVSAQDAAAGEKVFGVCRACHQVGETAKNNVGPSLNGLFGRKAGTIAGYNYSAANKDSGITWDEATFREYIKDPKAKIPGTKMIYAGLKDEQRTNDLIAYLQQFDAEGKKK